MRWVWPIALVLMPAALAAGPEPGRRLVDKGMARIEGGSFRPLFTAHDVKVATFAIDTLPVANGNKAKTNVSWADAAAVCKARGARLPTTIEWEYVAAASETRRNASADPAFKQRVLDLALRRGNVRLGSGLRNIWGVRDLHGGVFEWTDDTSAHHGHGQATTRQPMLCAGGAVQTGDASDYAAFLRHAFRSTANVRTGAHNVGFRCASSL